jgi:hypothetical protein
MTQATCFICAQPADTVEHVIPKWLQRRFDLWNQHISLPNGTSIPYRQLTIPACSRCNSVVLAPLEQCVESGAASESDIWKWANKIHYGLGFKHQFLEWDRRNPGYKIGSVVRQDDPLERDRHFLHSIAGHFRTDPDPFGSVFRFDFSTPQRFFLAHLMHSSSVCICLGDVGYNVFVTDGQALKRDVATSREYDAAPKGRLEDMLFFYAQNVEHLARHKLGQNIIMTDGFLARLGRTVVHDVSPPDKVRFRAICAALGLEWVDSDPDT